MCGRFIMVDHSVLANIAAEIAQDLAAHEGELASLDPLESYRHFLAEPRASEHANAFPSSVVALIAPTAHGTQVAIANMTWGFEVTWKAGLVFNTRLETALEKPNGMWGASLARRRCIVCAEGFYEAHGTETVPSKKTGRPIKRPYLFEQTNGAPLRMAAIHDKGRFSLVTTEPNATVAPVHNRMPLTLTQQETILWLTGNFEKLRELSPVELTSRPER